MRIRTKGEEKRGKELRERDQGKGREERGGVEINTLGCGLYASWNREGKSSKR